ncbi:MAG: glutamate--tRNA ligase [Methylophilaceae bacterium]
MMIITRFAPSPTGDLHIGGIRTALFSWAYAKKHQGQFILRIEDSDVERSSQEAVDIILEGMQWLGLNPDGPIHYQSKRRERYDEVIEQLIKSGDAYYCYASKEELDALREEQMKAGQKPKYDGRWRPEDGKKLPNAPDHIKPVIRFKNPPDGLVTWIDKVKGEISINNEELDDFIIARSDGTPTYNFCVVVDDLDMGVTDVIRGDDHVNNTPRQINLFKALGSPIPNYAHLSMILGSDGQKLSKRHGSVSVLQYRNDGYLPKAINNYLARLGWSHGDDELFTMEQFCSWFDLDHITSSSAQFDFEKLNWVNNHYIKETSNELLLPLVKNHIKSSSSSLDDEKIMLAINLYKERANTIDEIARDIAFFFNDVVPGSDLIEKHIDNDRLLLVKEFMSNLIEVKWDDESINNLLKDFVKNKGIKFPHIAMPMRVILTGSDHTPSIGSIIFILGLNETQNRLNNFLKTYD